MKKIIYTLLLVVISMGMYAAETDSVVTKKPTSDVKVYVGDTLYTMPREVGTLQKHRNKVSKWARIAGNASSVVGAAGMLGSMVGAHSGSLSGFSSGMIASSSATVVGRAAEAADSFGGME